MGNMKDKADLEKDVRTGQQAHRILNDDLFRAAIQAVRDDAIMGFRAADPADTAALQKFRIMYEVTENFVNKLVQVIQSGQLAQNRIDASPEPNGLSDARH